MPIGVSDLGAVLDPIYESIKRICEDAAKQSNEAVVQGCLGTLGNMAAHAMTIVHTSDLRRTAPLAFSPVFYIGLCARAAIPVGMEDALLAAIEGTRKVSLAEARRSRAAGCRQPLPPRAYRLA